LLEAAGLADPKDPYAGFPMGAQSYSLRNYNLVEAVRHLQGMGLHHVEFFRKHLDPAASQEEIDETKKLLADADIALSAHGVNSFNKDHDKNRQVFEFARRAGIKTITANPTPDKETFDSLDKLCEEFNVRIAIHNHGPGALYDTIASVQKVCDGRHKLIGACVDTGHFLRSKEDPVKAVYELGPRVYGVHVKDEEKMEKQSHNVIIGSGHLDLVGLFKALRDIKFPADGALSLEYEANPENPIDDMKQCLDAAREAIAKLK
jgi:sugar phosphate isomerase/epimerase